MLYLTLDLTAVDKKIMIDGMLELHFFPQIM